MKSGAHKIMARAGIAVASAAGLACALPSLAFASEAEEKTGIALILPDMNEFIPMLLAFIIILVVLGKFGWPVFENIMVKRENAIRESLEKSEQARIDAEKLLVEYQEELAGAKAEAAKIVADAKQAGDAVKADITAKAQAEAEDMIAKARVAIEAEKKQAVAELQGSIADTSIAVASRVIGSDLSDAEHRAIIERYVNEAGSFNAN